MDVVKKHYQDEAQKLKDSKQSTMKDINIRDKEVERLLTALQFLKKRIKNPSVLEIGCGNGYTAECLINQSIFKSLTCIDYCEEFIKVAKQRKLKGASFKTGNVLDLDFEDETFDIVFTERCLINILTWEEQKKAIDEIRKVLKKKGYYVMIEAFADGFNNCNEARAVVSLPSIPQPFHNLYFDKKTLLQYLKNTFIIIEDDESFLSTYYYGSRVLYPALIEGKKELVYNNKFIEFFRYLPGYGNYSSIQLLTLQKK